MPADATIETAEGPTITIDGRRYDWFPGNGYLGFQSDPDLLAVASETTLRYGLKLRDVARWAAIRGWWTGRTRRAPSSAATTCCSWHRGTWAGR